MRLLVAIHAEVCVEAKLYRPTEIVLWYLISFSRDRRNEYQRDLAG
jgi:hypothetical protein